MISFPLQAKITLKDELKSFQKELQGKSQNGSFDLKTYEQRWKVLHRKVYQNYRIYSGDQDYKMLESSILRLSAEISEILLMQGDHTIVFEPDIFTPLEKIDHYASPSYSVDHIDK